MAKRTHSIEDDVARWNALRRFRPKNIPRPGPGQESVWDYPRPPRLETVAEPVRIEHLNIELARTDRALRVCETASPPTYYLPLSGIKSESLRPVGGHSYCEWKGSAVYFDVTLGSVLLPRVAWGYPDPLEPYEALKGHIAFYVSPFDRCTVGEAVAQPQPGGFYGGWVLPSMVGPFKGEPGSERW